MDDYILRKDALKALVIARGYCPCAYSDIAALPAADVAPVKHGKWLNFYNDFSTAECSECAECFEVSPDKESEKEFFEAFKEFYNYCPNCGAKMDGGDEAP